MHGRHAWGSLHYGEYLTMKRRQLLTVFVAAALVALPAIGNAAHSGEATGRTQLHPVSESGVMGSITFEDNGVDTVTISGTASGLEPFGLYVSLIYDNASVPGGPFACEPGEFRPGDPANANELTFEEMIVGIWTVDGDGNGTLDAENFGFAPPFGFFDTFYVNLDRFDTVSIRSVADNFAVVACGEIATQPHN